MEHIFNLSTIIHLILIFWWYLILYFYYRNLNKKNQLIHKIYNNEIKSLYENDYKEKNTHKIKINPDWNIVLKRNFFLDFEYIVWLLFSIVIIYITYHNIYFLFSFSVISLVLIYSYFRSIKKYKNIKFNFIQKKIEAFNIFYNSSYNKYVYDFKEVKLVQIIDKTKDHFLSIQAFELNLVFVNNERINLVENSDINYIYHISNILSEMLEVKVESNFTNL